MKSYQAIKKAEEEFEVTQEEKANEIVFNINSKSLTTKGGIVFFNSDILIDFEERRKMSPDSFVSRLHFKFKEIVNYLNKELNKNGWMIDENFIFDFPASKLILVEGIGIESYVIHFKVIPC